MVRHRSRANLASPLPAPPSSRSLAAQLSPTASPQRRASPEYTGHALRQHLASLLDQKTTQLQMLGSMGQEILKQQQELETRIKGFDDDEDADDEVGEATKEKLKSLDEAMRQWEAQNDDMMMELGGKVCTCFPARESASDLRSGQRGYARGTRDQCHTAQHILEHPKSTSAEHSTPSNGHGVCD